jgi:hypothetical protein
MIDTSFFDKIFERIREAAAFLETSERKAVMRSLRILYFYPDGLLRCLNELIETEAADAGKQINAASQFLESVTETDRELAFITSPSVTTNLQLTVEMVEGLREVADFKSGVRASLHAIFFNWVFTHDRAGILAAAHRARRDIKYLNGKIQSLEKALRVKVDVK